MAKGTLIIDVKSLDENNGDMVVRIKSVTITCRKLFNRFNGFLFEQGNEKPLCQIIGCQNKINSINLELLPNEDDNINHLRDSIFNLLDKDAKLLVRKQTI